jgi:hypothetical protein
MVLGPMIGLQYSINFINAKSIIKEFSNFYTIKYFEMVRKAAKDVFHNHPHPPPHQNPLNNIHGSK